MDEEGNRTLMVPRALVAVAAALLLGAPTLRAQSVSGRVLDQVTEAPIRGATVTLLTPDHRVVTSVVTGADGRYDFDVASSGTYLLLAEVSGHTSLVSPELELVGGESRAHDFRIATLAGEQAEEQMDAQTLAQALAMVCESQLDSRSEGILVGVVRDSISALPLADVTTTLQWSEGGELRTRELVSGDDGSFVFCDAPAGSERRLMAEIAGVATMGEPFEVNAGMIKRRDLFLNLSDANRPGDLLGWVTDFETGKPVAGAEIRLRGTNFVAVTGETGGFSFEGVPWGVYFLEVEHIAYEAQAEPLRVMGDRAHEVDIQLATDAYELDPITVEVRSREWFGGMRDFRERRSRGFGYFMDEKDIERRGAVRVLDILREIPGVNVEMARSSATNPGRTTTQAIYFRNCWRYSSEGDQIFTPPLLYLNGVKQVRLDLARGDLDSVTPDDIAAIEVYRGAAEVPADFGGSDAGCGVIAIWTKRG